LGITLNRVRSLCLALPVALIALAVVSSSAGAQQYRPEPQGDDIAYLQLGAVSELVTLELFRSAAHSKALGASEKGTFKRLADQTAKGWIKLNSLLGEGAISREIFTVKIPAGVLKSRAKTVALATRFEKLLAGLYLGGVESTIDPPTRLLIGRHLTTSARDLSVLEDLRGGRPSMLAPKPLSVEYVGEQFERYLAIPGS